MARGVRAAIGRRAVSSQHGQQTMQVLRSKGNPMLHLPEQCVTARKASVLQTPQHQLQHHHRSLSAAKGRRIGSHSTACTPLSTLFSRPWLAWPVLAMGGLDPSHCESDVFALT